MVRKAEYYFPSSDGLHLLFVRQWLPEGEPRATLQLCHGVAEHSGRYEHFACYMAERGYAVVANDHLGHGRSVKDESELCFFAERQGWQYAVEDIYALRLSIEQQYPELPHFVFGHSMGSFLLRNVLIAHPGGYAAAIISGTGQQSPLMIKAGRLITGLEAGRIGLKGYSPLIQKLAFGSYNKGIKPLRTEFDWLTADSGIVDEYIADPLCGMPFTVGLFSDMLSGMSIIGKQSEIEKMDRSMPMLFLFGGQDPVGGKGAQVMQVYNRFKQAGCENLELKQWEKGRHEMLNEVNRAEVYAFVLGYYENMLK